MPTYLADSIPNMPEPFSGPNYITRLARSGRHNPCVLCGKPVKIAKPRMFYVADGGRVFVSEAEAERLGDDPGFMGAWAIGPDCYRPHAAAFQQLEQDSKKS